MEALLTGIIASARQAAEAWLRLDGARGFTALGLSPLWDAGVVVLVSSELLKHYVVLAVATCRRDQSYGLCAHRTDLVPPNSERSGAT
jgi:hypothetical protein